MSDVELEGPDEPDSLELPRHGPTDGVGLCLSGGGYRAMLFHVGALRRLNETGWLSRLTDVASVSGGSITAGQLGLVWDRLRFDAGVAGNFQDLVEKPIMELARHTVDRTAIVTGLFIPGRIAKRVQRRYSRLLFRDATLQSLPQAPPGPRFVLLATNLTNGRLWKFTREFMGDWSGPRIPQPDVPLAAAVSASSAFPPFLSPLVLDTGGKKVQLSDGGVYDNLGLEAVVKDCAVVFVSDGGGTFKEDADPSKNWIGGLLRVLDTVDVQVRRLRRRQIVGLLASKQRRGVFFAINTEYTNFAARSAALPASADVTRNLSRIKTRLRGMNDPEIKQLINWGYAACDAGLRTWVDPTTPQPTGFPYTEAPLGHG